MLNFTLFTATTCGDRTNCLYPNKQEITNRDSFSQAMQFDHVCGAFKNNYRSNENFLESNVIPMDCDNDHSDSAKDWVYPIDVARTFPDCTFYVNYSRSHLKPKGSKSARPRFHIYFPIPTITSGTEYAELKKKIQAMFPYFDEGALGEARFFFGTQDPQVEIYEGSKTILDFVSEDDSINSQFAMRNAQSNEFASQTNLIGKQNLQTNSQLQCENAQSYEVSQTDLICEQSSLHNCALPIAHCALEQDAFSEFDAKTEEISEGSRNTTMSHIAAKIIKRYGNSEAAYTLFLNASEKCNPPLDTAELKQIWNSACKFGQKIAQNPNYIPPEIYNSSCNLKPDDFSDVGQATVMAREYKDKLSYSPATDFLVYNGSFWEESEPLAQGLSQDITTRQLAEAESEITKLVDEMSRNGALEIIAAVGANKAIHRFNSEQQKTYELYEKAMEYRKYAIKRRDTRAVAAALHETIPLLVIDPNKLDSNEFALNCPDGTYDLRQGVSSKQEHTSEDFITKETLVNPGTAGSEIWKQALDTFFQKDQELIEYVQRIVGLASIGKVYVEALIIAYGEGRNGKSTFWNTIARVLGSYSGNISADMLTVGCRRNVKPELAEAKGKRLLIAAELEEGMRLNTSIIKQLCSTDEIYAEKKFKDPFSYIPTHTLVLYTNHLPKVGAIDDGTWRRLIVIPFNAKIDGKSDIKNYTDYLVNHAGRAILAWIIEGAQKVIKDNYNIAEPQVVKAAIGNYLDMNDWLSTFLGDKCIIDEDAIEKSGDFYNAYRAYCLQSGEYIRSTADFYTALDNRGFFRFRKNSGRFIKGVRLKNEFEE